MAIARAIHEVIAAPFRVDPEAAFTTSLVVREQERRKALLRLIVLIVLIIQILIPLPLSLLNGAQPLTLYAAILGNIVTLALNRAGRIFLGSILFLLSSAALLLTSALTNKQGFDAQVVFLLATLPIYLIVAGLVLPRWAIWPMTALFMLATVAVILAMPTPALQVVGATSVAPPSAPDLQSLSLRYLPSIELLIGILTWVFSRSARAGLETVARAFERERELVALKEQFLIDANHELRTPIMALYTNLEVIALLNANGKESQRALAIDQALGAGDILLRLLNSVLDASALESQAPRLTLSAVPMNTLMRSVLETFDPRTIGELGLQETAYRSRPIHMSIPEMLIVYADEGRVRQVLMNILANALKYSDPGSPIEIHAHVTDAITQTPALTQCVRAPRKRPATPSSIPSGERDTPPHYMRLSIRDHGLGIPPRDIPKLFNRFVRLERDIAGSVRGTGLGLYVCRILVTAMGGRIWIESAGIPGEGTTVSFTLPLAPAHSMPPTSAEHTPVGVANALPAQPPAHEH